MNAPIQTRVGDFCTAETTRIFFVGHVGSRRRVFAGAEVEIRFTDTTGGGIATDDEYRSFPVCADDYTVLFTSAR